MDGHTKQCMVDNNLELRPLYLTEKGVWHESKGRAARDTFQKHINYGLRVVSCQQKERTA